MYRIEECVFKQTFDLRDYIDDVKLFRLLTKKKDILGRKFSYFLVL